MSQPVRACKLGPGDLSKPTAPAYLFGVKLMFIGGVNFGQVKKIRFVGVNIFQYVLTLISVIFIGHVN